MVGSQPGGPCLERHGHCLRYKPIVCNFKFVFPSDDSLEVFFGVGIMTLSDSLFYDVDRGWRVHFCLVDAGGQAVTVLGSGFDAGGRRFSTG